MGCKTIENLIIHVEISGTVFENHRKSELRFEWTKVNAKSPKWSILASF